MDPNGYTRRTLLKGIAGGMTMMGIPSSLMAAVPAEMIQRLIPGSGQAIPAVGMGTWQTFNLSQRASATAVMKRFFELGGKVVDTSPMYGDAERALGVVTTDLDIAKELFMATKVWTSGSSQGKRQIERSYQLLARQDLDLIQVHNLKDWETHLPYLRELKQQGVLKYSGITHYLDSAHQQLEHIISRHPVDFLQINYNIANRNAEKNLFAMAADKGVAVIINRPYEEGGLFRKVRGHELPDWASEIDCSSWGQFFLKFILSHPAVTCVIPATSKVNHLEDNMGGGTGTLPDNKMREKMALTFASL